MSLKLVESERRLRARLLLERGTLPYLPHHHSYGGRGSGQQCSLCEHVITGGEVEYEVVDAVGCEYRFHLLCHDAWQAECTRKELLDRSG